MTQTEIDFEDKMTAVLNVSLGRLGEMEADYIRLYHLAQPRITLRDFSSKWSLSPDALKDLRSSAYAGLKLMLHAQNVRCMGDLL
jgi:hypothetical protein